MFYISFWLIYAYYVILDSFPRNKSNIFPLVYYYFAFLVAFLISFKGNEDEYTRLFILFPNIFEFSLNKYPVILEKGIVFSFIGSLFKSIELNSQSLFVFFGGGSVLLHAYYYRYFTPYHTIAFLCYLSHSIISNEMVGLRMGFASILILPLIICFMYRKYVLFFLIYFISFNIHYVSVLSIFILLINKLRSYLFYILVILFSYLFYLMDFMGIILIYLQDLNLLPNIISSYLKAETYVYDAGPFHFKFVQQLFCILFLLFFFKQATHFKFYPMLFNLYFLGTVIPIALSQYALFAFRIMNHFSVVEPILITYIIFCFKNKLCLKLTLIFLFLLLSIYNYVIAPKISPYFFLIAD